MDNGIDTMRDPKNVELTATCIHCGEGVRTEDFEVAINVGRWDVEFDCPECGERNERWGRPYHGGPRCGADMDGYLGPFEISAPWEIWTDA